MWRRPRRAGWPSSGWTSSPWTTCWARGADRAPVRSGPSPGGPGLTSRCADPAGHAPESCDPRHESVSTSAQGSPHDRFEASLDGMATPPLPPQPPRPPGNTPPPGNGGFGPPPGGFGPPPGDQGPPFEGYG